MRSIGRRCFHWVHGLLSGNYTTLLICLFLVFVFRPYGRETYYLGIWKILLEASLLAAVFNCHYHRSIKIIVAILSVPALILTWVNLIEHNEAIFVATLSVTIAFLGISAMAILYDVVLRARVTLETLRGVICAYFLIGFMFAYIYHIIDYIVPGTFAISSGNISEFSFARYFSEMIYFSFITLLSIGYGDVVAVKDVGQTAVVLEGIMGQFYVAILVARIVSAYSITSDKNILHAIKEDIEKIK